MRESFARALQAGPDQTSESWLRMGAGIVRLRVVGRKWSALLASAWLHLRVGSGKPDLCIDLWDGQQCQIPAPLPATRSALESELQVSQGEARHRMFASVATMDRIGAQVVGCCSDLANLSLYERGRPFHPFLSLWHNDRHRSLVHAALVAWKGRGFLLGGPSGSGKTTSALACWQQGFDYLGEDMVSLEVPQEGPCQGHSLYASCFVEKQPNLSLRALSGHHAHEQKSLLMLPADRLAASVPIERIILPRVLGAPRCMLRPATAGQALLALAPSTLMVGPLSAGAPGMQRLSSLLQRTPCYWLDLGPAEQIPEQLISLL